MKGSKEILKPTKLECYPLHLVESYSFVLMNRCLKLPKNMQMNEYI